MDPCDASVQTPDSGLPTAGTASRQPSHRVGRPWAALLVAVLAICSVLLAACTTSRQIVLPVSGINSRVFVIDCSGASLTWSHCYRKAGETCPLGYAILENSYKHGDRVVAGDTLQLIGNSAQRRRMLIDCRAPGKAGRPPAQSDDPHPRGVDTSGSPRFQR